MDTFVAGAPAGGAAGGSYGGIEFAQLLNAIVDGSRPAPSAPAAPPPAPASDSSGAGGPAPPASARKVKLSGAQLSKKTIAQLRVVRLCVRCAAPGGGGSERGCGRPASAAAARKSGGAESSRLSPFSPWRTTKQNTTNQRRSLCLCACAHARTLAHVDPHTPVRMLSSSLSSSSPLLHQSRDGTAQSPPPALFLYWRVTLLLAPFTAA